MDWIAKQEIGVVKKYETWGLRAAHFSFSPPTMFGGRARALLPSTPRLLSFRASSYSFSSSSSCSSFSSSSSCSSKIQTIDLSPFVDTSSSPQVRKVRAWPWLVSHLRPDSSLVSSLLTHLPSLPSFGIPFFLRNASVSLHSSTLHVWKPVSSLSRSAAVAFHSLLRMVSLREGPVKAIMASQASLDTLRCGIDLLFSMQ